jgi:hypothetical protein
MKSSLYQFRSALLSELVRRVKRRSSRCFHQLSNAQHRWKGPRWRQRNTSEHTFAQIRHPHIHTVCRDGETHVAPAFRRPYPSLQKTTTRQKAFSLFNTPLLSGWGMIACTVRALWRFVLHVVRGKPQLNIQRRSNSCKPRGTIGATHHRVPLPILHPQMTVEWRTRVRLRKRITHVRTDLQALRRAHRSRQRARLQGVAQEEGE